MLYGRMDRRWTEEYNIMAGMSKENIKESVCVSVGDVEHLIEKIKILLPY
jgi:hypothetical protein